MSNLPVVAIVGRPNVGKSSLVNRIINKREAIVHDTPGVTRDRKYFQAEWLNHDFRIIDTGGIYTNEVKTSTAPFQEDIEKQVQLAIQEADLIIFLVDGQEGLHPIDKAIGALLQRSATPVILVINKIDTDKHLENIYEFHQIGLEKIFTISAQHGRSIGDLLDEVIKLLPQKEAAPETSERSIRIAIVGRPNVGKSSLLNSLLGQERVLVSDIPGTTRDSIDERIIRDNTNYIFVDTAGIRKKARINEDIEYYAVNRAIKAIENCDLAILVLDATILAEDQDKKIASLIQNNSKGCLLVINKWDLIEKDTNTILDFTRYLQRQLPFLTYCPVLFVSALTKQRLQNIYAEINAIYANYSQQIETSAFNKALKSITNQNPPKVYQGKTLKIYYATQVKTKPPTFLLFVNNHKFLDPAYQRYLENQLREHFTLTGSPIQLVFRNKN